MLEKSSVRIFCCFSGQHVSIVILFCIGCASTGVHPGEPDLPKSVAAAQCPRDVPCSALTICEAEGLHVA
jgi:hypothetical protein